MLNQNILSPIYTEMNAKFIGNITCYHSGAWRTQPMAALSCAVQMGTKAGTAALPTQWQKAERQNLLFFVPDLTELK